MVNYEAYKKAALPSNGVRAASFLYMSYFSIYVSYMLPIQVTTYIGSYLVLAK